MFRTTLPPFVFVAVFCAAALGACAGSAVAEEIADPATFRLTPSLMDRMEKVAAELRHLPAPAHAGDGDEDGEDDVQSVQDIARRLDGQPQVRAALKRQGLTSRLYATAMLAALHAGMALAMEKAPGATAGAGFTPEQRANIELMRARRERARP